VKCVNVYLQFYSVKEVSKNYDICIRVLFDSCRVRFGSVFGKTRVPVRFFIAGFEFFPISIFTA